MKLVNQAICLSVCMLSSQVSAKSKGHQYLESMAQSLSSGAFSAYAVAYDNVHMTPVQVDYYVQDGLVYQWVKL